jgi:hypothetical protein
MSVMCQAGNHDHSVDSVINRTLLIRLKQRNIALVHKIHIVLSQGPASGAKCLSDSAYTSGPISCSTVIGGLPASMNYFLLPICVGCLPYHRFAKTAVSVENALPSTHEVNAPLEPAKLTLQDIACQIGKAI